MRVAIVFAALAAALGAVVLGSWLISPTPDLIKTPLAGTRAMGPNTALLLILVGAAVIARARPSPRGRWIGVALAGAPVALAALTSIELATGVDLHIDGLLAASAPPPAAITCATFLLLGVAAIGLDVTRAPFLIELAALAAMTIALIVGVGHLFDYAYFASPAEHGGGMAPHTALGAFLLGLALLHARPSRGLMAILTSPFIGGVVARRMLMIGLVATPLAGAISVALQHAGLYPAPGAAVVDTVLSMVLLFGALVLLGRLLNRADAQRTDVEAELRAWKGFFDRAEFGAVFGGPDGELLRCNDAFARMHGYTADELAGRSIESVFAPEAREQARAEIRAVEEKGAHRFESIHIRRDGTTFPVVIDATAVRDGAGRLQYRVAYVQDIRAERQAQEAKARLAALVESAEDAIIAKRLDGTVIDWNRGAERTYGWTREEMIGRSILAIVPADLRDERDQIHARFERGETIGQLETERLRKDGRRIPISVSYSRIVGDDGEVIGVSTIEHDISERRAAADALQGANRRLEALREAHLAVSDAIAGLGATGIRPVLEVIASQAKLLTGADYAAVDVAPPEEGAARPVAEAGAMPTRIARGTGPVAAPSADDGDVIDVPVVYRGEVKGKLVLIGKEPRFDDGDRRAAEMLAAYLGSAVEIAILYERERLQRSWFESVLAQMPESVVVVDQRGAIVLENAVSAAMPVDRVYTGERRTRHARNLCLPSGEPVPPDEQPGRRALRGETVEGEYALRHPDRTLVPFAISAAPVRIGERIAGAVVVARDLRTQKQLERMREEWSSVIAHELRQPVNSIRLAAELVARAPLEARPRAWIERITADALRLNAMIQDLLDSSRLEARRLSLRVEELSLVDLLATALERTPALAARATVDVGAGAARVQADAGRLLQVISNLLSNAEKYGTPGTPIAIQAERDGAMVRVSITNHGPGIAADDIPRLFDRFVRTRAAQESRVEGIGLGLYLSKGLIEAQGGRMWVDSTPGATTTFSLTIPAAIDREDSVEHASVAAE